MHGESEMTQAEANEQLFNAVTKGSLDDCQRALDAGANINARNDTGDTPLHTAVCTVMLAEKKDVNHKLAVAHFLAEHGADTNAHDAHQLTPSQLGEQLGKEQATQLLFKA